MLTRLTHWWRVRHWPTCPRCATRTHPHLMRGLFCTACNHPR